ncbi:Nn.00g014300.m01.CDS01 [Neocucurbitaria sp. VM-36]
MSDQGQRIEANCKKIWGADKTYDLTIETDDYEHYMCHVKVDYGTSYGPPLTMTSLCNGPDRAWNELDRMLRLWARQVESGRPMTREENLEIFSGPDGRWRKLLERVMDRRDEVEAIVAANRANRANRA